MKVRITGVQAARNRIYQPRDLQKNPDLFPEGSDAWMALNAGRNIKLDDQGFIIDVWDRNNNHYDPMTSERIALEPRMRGGDQEGRQPLLTSRVKGKTESCWQHR